uniref:Uncharacterized protein n=1 Tax=Trichuris muris TaxID=70415 RepID=A0A5S6R1K5_TRIMR
MRGFIVKELTIKSKWAPTARDSDHPINERRLVIGASAAALFMYLRKTAAFNYALLVIGDGTTYHHELLLEKRIKNLSLALDFYQPLIPADVQ